MNPFLKLPLPGFNISACRAGVKPVCLVSLLVGRDEILTRI
jgi:hypothetical protein